jgi:hypothetical protein
MRMQHHSVDRRQPAQQLFHLGGRQTHLSGNLRSCRTYSALHYALDQLEMQSGNSRLIRHLSIINPSSIRTLAFFPTTLFDERVR